MNVGLVACGKRKRNHAVPAAILYTGELFRKASAYCAATYDRWYILSALHGLVDPGAVLGPYDVTLAGASAAVRRDWAMRVAAQIRDGGHGRDTLFFHAGRDYAGMLADGFDSRLPVAGLGIGRQLAWYKARGF